MRSRVHSSIFLSRHSLDHKADTTTIHNAGSHDVCVTGENSSLHKATLKIHEYTHTHTSHSMEFMAVYVVIFIGIVCCHSHLGTKTPLTVLSDMSIESRAEYHDFKGESEKCVHQDQHTCYFTQRRIQGNASRYLRQSVMQSLQIYFCKFRLHTSLQARPAASWIKK